MTSTSRLVPSLKLAGAIGCSALLIPACGSDQASPIDPAIEQSADTSSDTAVVAVDTSTAAPPSDQAIVVELLVIEQSSGDGGDGALLQGELVLLDDCVVIEGEDGRSAIVWPSSATWDAVGMAVELTGSSYRIGDDIELGGGEIEPETVGSLVGSTQLGMANKCSEAAQGSLFLVNG